MPKDAAAKPAGAALWERGTGPEMEAVRAAMDALPIGVVFAEFIPGEGPFILSHNAAYARVVGAKVHPSTPFDELPFSLYLPDRMTRVPPEEWPAPTAARTGSPVPERELHLRRSNGEWRVLMVSAAPLPRADGDDVGRAAGVLLDVTERRRAEEDLTRRGQLLRLVIETSPDPIFVKNRKSQILFANPATMRAIGLPAEQVIGRSDRGFYGDSSAGSAIEENDRRVMERGVEEVVEETVPSPGGERVFLSTKTPWRDSTGAVIGLIGIARDITERKAAEKLLLQSQKLDSIGRLAGGIAHDFNNLLTVILCSAESEGEALDAGRAVDREDVEQIREAGERARDLTRHLLSFARRQVIAPSTVDLNGTLAGSERLLQRLLGETVRLEVSPGPDLWPVHCDPAQIEQVLFTLAVNARDAMPSGGTLSISTANVQVGSGRSDPPAGDWVRLRVRDSGGGMSREVKDHLFEPFFTTKPFGRGTGLGLATAYGIVRQAGGHLRVESEPGEGTTFDVLLPRSAPAAVEAPPPSRSSAPGGTETVLLVEDDAAVREAAARALRSGGYRVIAAAGAAGALEALKAEAHPPAMLVTDVVMPETTGRELADLLRREQPGLRVLFLSGYAQDLIGRAGVVDPSESFLAKPFTAASLLSRVRKVLDSD